jgi:hypothetical protein
MAAVRAGPGRVMAGVCEVSGPEASAEPLDADTVHRLPGLDQQP